jgi:hypothetical protein
MTGTGKVTVETLQRLVGAFHAHDLDVRAGLASRFAGIPGARRPSSSGRPRPAPGSCR